jgi:hypothetical protein
MLRSTQRYSLESVKQDVKSFFLDDNHWAYQYGSKATSCHKDSVFYKKQIQVIFEDRYPHDVTGKAVNELIGERFLREEPRIYGNNMHTIFVCRRSVRYVATEIKTKLGIMERFCDDELNIGVGEYAEILFSHMFEKNNFQIVGRDTNIFRGKMWTRSDKNLDFIIEKDGISYGVEVKNTFDYMPPDEFGEKVDMCQFLGLLPVFPLRCPSPQQYALMGQVDGLALEFKARIFPPGNQKLVTQVWNHFRLPVAIWANILPSIEKIFLNFHAQTLATRQ